jgi:small subunit ribosomal protein S20
VGAFRRTDHPEGNVPHKKSAVKRLRQSKRLNARNRSAKAEMATAVKKVATVAPEEREAAFRKAVSAIDKAVKLGVIKKETGSRKKSRLAKAVSKAG